MEVLFYHVNFVTVSLNFSTMASKKVASMVEYWYYIMRNQEEGFYEF